MPLSSADVDDESQAYHVGSALHVDERSRFAGKTWRACASERPKRGTYEEREAADAARLRAGFVTNRQAMPSSSPPRRHYSENSTQNIGYYDYGAALSWRPLTTIADIRDRWRLAGRRATEVARRRHTAARFKLPEKP